MIRCFTISFLTFLFCSSIYAANDWSQFQGHDIYPVTDKSNCVFPFTYKGVQYNDCTTDGDNGNLPWCSLTTEYNGLFTYCYDFWNTTLQCELPFTLNGKTFDKCDYLSRVAPYKQCKTNNPKYRYRYCIEEHVKKSNKPLIRLDQCDPVYKALSKYPTMCIGPSDYAIQVPITEQEKDEILQKHNEYRGAVKSRYMFKLYWDDELAKIAQAHSDMCAFDHDLAANRLSSKYKWKNGQNMVMSTETRTPLATLLDMMFSSEKQNFRYGDTCYPGEGSCLHYTQAMLSNMTRVGCGQTHCLFPDHIERYLTCNYIQSQYQDNYNIPYVPSDTSAIDCPAHQDGNLCDCKNKICDYNQGEYLEPATCDCKKSVGKRSIDKRDADEDDVALNNNQKPFVAVPSAKNLDVLDVNKRSFNIIEQKQLPKRNFGKKFKLNQEDQSEVVNGINELEANLHHH